jgi:hypothetical protein
MARGKAPGAPSGHPVTITAEGGGRIPCYYIECLRDRAITLKLQQGIQNIHPVNRCFPLTPIIPNCSPHLSSLQIVFSRLAAPRGCYGRLSRSTLFAWQFAAGVYRRTTMAISRIPAIDAGINHYNSRLRRCFRRIIRITSNSFIVAATVFVPSHQPLAQPFLARQNPYSCRG